MHKLATVLLVCLTTLLVFAQSSPKYQTATIVEVVPFQTAEDAAQATAVYDVSLRVKDTVYVVRCKASSGTVSVKYSAGMQLLVLVGEDTIKFNDLLGRSFEAPIVKKRPAPVSQSKASLR